MCEPSQPFFWGRWEHGAQGVQLVVQVMAPNRKIFALKRIKLQGKDSEASKGFVDEITLLQRLRGKQNIIQLVDAEVTIIMIIELKQTLLSGARSSA